MAFVYPFYGRVFTVLLRIPVRPWFKGEEASARWWAAFYLVTLHQTLILLVSTGIYRDITGAPAPISKLAFGLISFSLLAANALALSRWRKPPEPHKFFDAIFIGAFVVTSVALVAGLFVFDPSGAIAGSSRQ